jgi:hypothetical protein
VLLSERRCFLVRQKQQKHRITSTSAAIPAPIANQHHQAGQTPTADELDSTIGGAVVGTNPPGCGGVATEAYPLTAAAISIFSVLCDNATYSERTLGMDERSEANRPLMASPSIPLRGCVTAS